MFREEGWELLQQSLVRSSSSVVSAATYVELFIVLERRFGSLVSYDVDEFLDELRVEILPFDTMQAKLARQACRQYGKGRHPAGLNFGDCFSYALAKQRGEPLLCKGNDFVQTDLVIA